MSNDQFLETIVLDAHQWRGLLALQGALREFEPLAKRTGLGQVVAERLVALGLAEKGEAIGYLNRGMPIGYRLTDLGWKVVDRGRWPKRRRTASP